MSTYYYSRAFVLLNELNEYSTGVYSIRYDESESVYKLFYCFPDSDDPYLVKIVPDTYILCIVLETLINITSII